MNSVSTSIVIIPGVVALLLCLLFSYLYQQSRQIYFRVWQIAWGCYSIRYLLDAFRYYRPPATAAFLVRALCLVAMAVCIFVSTRLTGSTFSVRWYDWVLAGIGLVFTAIDLRIYIVSGGSRPGEHPVSFTVIFLSTVLLYCSAVFYIHA